MLQLRRPWVFQGGVGVPGHDAAGVERDDRPMRARADRPRGSGAVRSVRRPARGVGRLRLHGEGVGPGNRGVSAHAAGTHQQSLLTAGNRNAEPRDSQLSGSRLTFSVLLSAV